MKFKTCGNDLFIKLRPVLAAILVMALFIGGNFFYAKSITVEIPDPENFFQKAPADTSYGTIEFYLAGDVNETVFEYINTLRDEHGMRIVEKEKNSDIEYSYTLRGGSGWFDLVDEWFAEVQLPEVTIDVEDNRVFVFYNNNCSFVN